MVFHSFSDWSYAMGNTLQSFKVHEREADKPLQDLYYRNYVGSEWSVEERFESEDDDTTLVSASNWAALVGDSPTATCYATFLDERGYFYDHDNANHNDIIMTFSEVSSGAGWSKIRVLVDYPTGNATDSDLIISIRDAITNIAMKFHLLNGKAYLMEGVNNRVLQIAAVDIDPIGYHDFELWFDEDNKKVKVYFDGVEAVTATGFEDYFNIAASALADMQFTGNNACDGLDVYLDNIAVDWIDTAFDAWVVGMRVDKDEGVGSTIDKMGSHIMRVDAIDFPIVIDLEIGDEIIQVSNSKIFKIMKKVPVDRYLNIRRFEIKETV